MQSNTSPRFDKPQKSIFSSFPSHPKYESRIHHTGGNFASHTMDNLLYNHQTTKKTLDRQDLTQRLMEMEEAKDGYTQTSKTILQLAQEECHADCPGDTRALNYHYPDSSSPSITNSPRELEDKVETPKIQFNRKTNIINFINAPPPSSDENVVKEHRIDDNSLTRVFLEKTKSKSRDNSGHSQDAPCVKRSEFLQQTSPLRKMLLDDSDRFKSVSCIETAKNNVIGDHASKPVSRFKIKSIKNKDIQERTKPVRYYCQPQGTLNLQDQKSFMLPTFASEKRKTNASYITNLISPTRRGRSASPKKTNFPSAPNLTPDVRPLCVPNRKVPYIDGSDSNSSYSECEPKYEKDERKVVMPPLSGRQRFEEDIKNIDELSLDLKTSDDGCSSAVLLDDSISTMSNEVVISGPLIKLKNPDWNVSIKGLAEIIDVCKQVDNEIIFPYMTCVNQKLIELLRSPRSHVCRTACQAAGHLFQYVKDTRRPEFDDIVELLLFKTADANKFIRQDANLALDCMVTHIPTTQSIRVLHDKGPSHKNPLVRTATVRLIVCAVVIAGPEFILNPNNNEHTRKRIFTVLPKIMNDKHTDVRKFGERLYKILSKESRFDVYLKKYLEKDTLANLKKNLKFVAKK